MMVSGPKVPPPPPVPNENVEKFVQAMDIGDIHNIPQYCRAAHTVRVLTYYDYGVYHKLIWFKDIENHYIFEFSDGAPESRDNWVIIIVELK